MFSIVCFIYIMLIICAVNEGTIEFSIHFFFSQAIMTIIQTKRNQLMRNTFTLFQSHLDKAHQYWSQLLQEGDLVVDATCGNGHDTLFLAKMGVKVYAMDLQQQAIQNAKELVASEINTADVLFFQGCHSTFPVEILPNSVRLVVYNLGYLPGGDKQITTGVNTTIASVEQALHLIDYGGMISITCYPGHEEGEREEGWLLSFCGGLNPKMWSCCHHKWLNRKSSPSLLLIQKSKY